MRSELAENLKTVLDNMSQEQFNKEWEEIENQGFPNVILLTENKFIKELSEYVSQMIPIAPKVIYKEFIFLYLIN